MKKILVLHSAYSPNAAAEALRRSIDEEHRTLFSLSGYKGSNPVLGKVCADSFRLRKRIRYRNDFARQFYGRFQPESGGTRVECYFAVPRITRIFTTFWFAFLVLVGTPVFVESLRELASGTHSANSNPAVGLLMPPALVLFGIALVWFCRLLSRSGERFLLEHLQTTLSARIESDPDLQIFRA